MGEINKEYKVVISERATDILIEDIRFLSAVNLQAANNLRVEMMEFTESLRHSPSRNPFIYDPLFPANKYRKLVINERYVMIYQIKDEVVYVDYMLDCRQNYQWLL